MALNKSDRRFTVSASHLQKASTPLIGISDEEMYIIMAAICLVGDYIINDYQEFSPEMLGRIRVLDPSVVLSIGDKVQKYLKSVSGREADCGE